jgi:hypothetical protein
MPTNSLPRYFSCENREGTVKFRITPIAYDPIRQFQCPKLLAHHLKNQSKFLNFFGSTIVQFDQKPNTGCGALLGGRVVIALAAGGAVPGPPWCALMAFSLHSFK